MTRVHKAQRGPRRRRARRATWWLTVMLSSAIVALFSTALKAQTLALPATAPDSLRAGASAIVRPTVRDVIGRPTSVARVIAVSSDTTVVSVNYASGGQRYTARAVGVAFITWVWDRTDGRRFFTIDTVRVVPAPTAPPPVNVPLSVASLTLTPSTALQLTVGDTARIRLVGARVRGGTSSAVREATASELAGLTLRWSLAGTSVSVSPAGLVTALKPGFTLVTICAATACDNRGISVAAPPVVVDPPVDTVPAGELIGSRPCRAFTATAFGRIEADTAYFVSVLPGVPSVVYCVDNSLTIVEEGVPVPDLVSLVVAPEGLTRLAPGDTVTMTVTGGTMRVDGKLRAATLADLRAGVITWTVSGAGLKTVSVSDDALSARFTRIGATVPLAAIVTACIGAFDSKSTCYMRPVQPPDPAGDSSGAALLRLSADTISVGETTTLTLTDSTLQHFSWSMSIGSPELSEVVPKVRLGDLRAAALAAGAVRPAQPQAGSLFDFRDDSTMTPDPAALNTWPWNVATYAPGVPSYLQRTATIRGERPGVVGVGVRYCAADNSACHVYRVPLVVRP